MDSKTQPQPQLTCSIHNQPACAIKCTDLGEGSTIKCILCIIKRNLEAKDLITLLEIFNPEVEQASRALLQLTDEQMATLTKIKSENPDRLIARISDFFSTLKEEAIQKINEQEKIAMDQANDLIEAQKKLNEKYLEFTSRQDLNALITTNQSNQEILNEELKKYFKKLNESQHKRIQEMQELIMKYENVSFSEDDPIIFKQRILDNIREINFFSVFSKSYVQEIDGINLKQVKNLQVVINSTERFSKILSTAASLFQSNELLDFSFVHTLLKENQNNDSCVNLKDILHQNQQKLIEVLFNSDKSVKKILQILKPLTISQRLNALSVLVQNLPTQDILSKLLFKSKVSKCQFVNSKYPQSKPIQSQFDFPSGTNTPILKLFNQGFSSLFSDQVLDPKLKYQLEIIFNNKQPLPTNEQCYFGLLPDKQKDKSLMSDLRLAFQNNINISIQRQQEKLQQINETKQPFFRNTIFICISEQTFIVCDQKGDIIFILPKESIQSTTEYRIGIQFQNENSRSICTQPEDLFERQPYKLFQQYHLNLTIQSFQILDVFPSFYSGSCI